MPKIKESKELAQAKKELVEEFSRNVSSLKKELKKRYPTKRYPDSIVKTSIIDRMKQEFDTDTFNLTLKVLMDANVI
jgi:hypothetical protein